MTAPIFDRVPPQNIEAERSVLGGILLNPEALCDVLDVLRGDPAEIFYVEAHQHLYAAILSLFRASKPVDSLMLMEALNAAGTLEAAGGISYIAGLTSAVPTSANVRYYAEIVTGAAILRKLISLCSKIAGFAYTPNMNANNLLVEAQEQILALSSEQTAGIRTIADGVEGAVDRILSLYKHGNTGGLMTGFSNLDTIIAGIEPEAVAVLATASNVGATHAGIGPLRPTAERRADLAATTESRNSGAEGDRTPDLCSAIAALSQLSYSPSIPAGRWRLVKRRPVALRSLQRQAPPTYDRAGPTSRMQATAPGPKVKGTVTTTKS